MVSGCRGKSIEFGLCHARMGQELSMAKKQVRVSASNSNQIHMLPGFYSLVSHTGGKGHSAGVRNMPSIQWIN